MCVSPERARALALALPGASERPHFHRQAFRTPRKTFATLDADAPDLNLMFDPDLRDFYCEQAPDAFSPVPGGWGRMGSDALRPRRRRRAHAALGAPGRAPAGPAQGEGRAHMKPRFEILRLGPAELPRLRELNALFARAFDDVRSYAAEPPDDAWLERLLAREHVIVLIALAAGGVVGGLVAYELEKFERARREIYIYDLAVDEAHRRRGVATALIARLKQIARARAAWVIFVQGDPGDEPALALYDKLGTREEVLHFDILP